MDEFTLIERYFRPLSSIPPAAGQVDLGIGDDCALLSLPGAGQWAVSTDTLVAGVHFFADVDPADLGWKVLAVNLSDLAAMGATPAWFTLAITLPSIDERWLEQFSSGMQQLAKLAGIPLVGGDTTQGPLAMTVTVGGVVEPGKALTRSGAAAGDAIYVSGELGWAAYGFALLQGQSAKVPDADQSKARQALLRPQPQLALGRALVGIASACIDISDGLLGDLLHLVTRSHLAAQLDPHLVPVPGFARVADVMGLPDCVGFGDDYQLLFTVPAAREEQVAALATALDVTLTRIGVIRTPADTDPGRILDTRLEALPLAAYRHFAAQKGS